MHSKVCTKCGQLQPLSAYYAMKGMRDGHRNDCIECNKAAKRARNAANPELNRQRVREWQEANPERLKAYQAEYRRRPDRKRKMRDLYYQREHGITADRADEILDAQGGVCAICGKRPERLGSMHLDHDHESGRIRQFLCITCNQGLGLFQDDHELLRAAAEYLERHAGDAA